MQPEIRTIGTSVLMKRFAPYFKKYLPMLILDLFCAALTTICDVALPLIGVAGAQRYDELMMPISLALAARCDAVLRIGGPSRGADREVQVFVDKGLPVYRSVQDVPSA